MAQTSRAKGTASQMPGDGYYYFGADENGDAAEKGLWKCLIADIGDRAKHIRIYEALEPVGDEGALLHFHLNSDLFLCGAGYSHGGEPTTGPFHSMHMWWSDDLITFHEEELELPGAAWGIRIHEISNKKYQIDYNQDYVGLAGNQSIIFEFD